MKCMHRTNERINRMNVEYVRERMRTESQAGMVLLLFFSPRNVQRCFIIMNGTLWIEMLWYGFMFAAEYFVFAFSVYLLFDYILWFFFLLSLSCVTSLWCLILAICFNMFTFDVRTFYCRLVYIFVRASTQITCYFCYSVAFPLTLTSLQNEILQNSLDSIRNEIPGFFFRIQRNERETYTKHIEIQIENGKNSASGFE